MTVDDNTFSNGAVGVAFIDPHKTGTVHLTVNPETGAIVLAEAHPIRLRGAGVNTDILNELGNTATALIAEYISNYLRNSLQKDENIKVSDPAFKTLLGQTVSGLDQMLVDTVTHGQGETVAYQMDESRKQKSPPRSSLINRISNSLEAIVYYNGGIHISHRGESQQYLVGNRVQKLTQDYIAGGLFSKIGAVGDFIPEVQTSSVAMKKDDHLVLLSREAALSSFPLNNMKLWMENADPRDQAQRVAEEIKKLGRERGCVVVFSPGWQGSRSDDIVANGMFSLNNLANLEKDEGGRVSLIPSHSEGESAEATMSGASVIPQADKRPSTARKRPAKRNSNLKLKARTSRAADKLTSLPPADPFEPRRSHRRSIIESEIHAISQKVIDQLPDQLDLLETRLNDEFKGRLSGMQRDIMAQTSREVSKSIEKWVEDEIPRLEDRLEAQFQEELTDLEMRLGGMMGKGVAGLRAEINTIKSQLQQMVHDAEGGPQLAGGASDVEKNGQKALLLNDEDIAFSTIPGAIFGTSRRPEDQHGKKQNAPEPPVAKPVPVTPVKNMNRTLPAPAAYEVPSEDEESTTISSHEEISAQASTYAIDENDLDSTPIDDAMIVAETVDESVIPLENNDDLFPIEESGSKKTLAAILIAIVTLAAVAAFLFSPWSPLTAKTEGENSTAATAASNERKIRQTPKKAASKPRVKSSEKKVETAQVPQTPDTIPKEPIAPPPEKNASPYAISPAAGMNGTALYNKGMALYKIGDSKKDGAKKLNRKEQHEVLLSALSHFSEATKRGEQTPVNVWYVKGRTEYHLTKTEKSKDQRLNYAQAALASYDRFLERKKSISKAKEKTIRRNQRTLKKTVRRGKK